MVLQKWPWPRLKCRVCRQIRILIVKAGVVKFPSSPRGVGWRKVTVRGNLAEVSRFWVRVVGGVGGVRVGGGSIIGQVAESSRGMQKSRMFSEWMGVYLVWKSQGRSLWGYGTGRGGLLWGGGAELSSRRLALVVLAYSRNVARRVSPLAGVAVEAVERGWIGLGVGVGSSLGSAVFGTRNLVKERQSAVLG